MKLAIIRIGIEDISRDRAVTFKGGDEAKRVNIRIGIDRGIVSKKLIKAKDDSPIVRQLISEQRRVKEREEIRSGKIIVIPA